MGDTLRTPFTPDITTAGTAIVLLNERLDRKVMVILADGPESLQSVVSRLESGTFRDGLVSDFLGVYQLQ